MKAIDQDKTVNELIVFISSSFKKDGFKQAVIALSGGVDSSTSAALAVNALGATNVYPLLLPYASLNSIGVEDTKAVIKFLGIPSKNITQINIAPLVDPIIGLDPEMDNIRRGNIMARVRMITLFDGAKKRNALVIGTENKSEHLLGYYTRFGDEGSDIEPLRNLYKTQVYELATFLKLPDIILTKAPTAGLWEGQTDEEEFGFTYSQADQILSLVVDEKQSVEQVVNLGFDRNVIDAVLKRMKANEFKHRLPILP